MIKIFKNFIALLTIGYSEVSVKRSTNLVFVINFYFCPIIVILRLFSDLNTITVQFAVKSSKKTTFLPARFKYFNFCSLIGLYGKFRGSKHQYWIRGHNHSIRYEILSNTSCLIYNFSRSSISKYRFLARLALAQCKKGMVSFSSQGRGRVTVSKLRKFYFFTKIICPSWVVVCHRPNSGHLPPRPNGVAKSGEH